MICKPCAQKLDIKLGLEFHGKKCDRCGTQTTTYDRADGAEYVVFKLQRGPDAFFPVPDIVYRIAAMHGLEYGLFACSAGRDIINFLNEFHIQDVWRCTIDAFNEEHKIRYDGLTPPDHKLW